MRTSCLVLVALIVAGVGCVPPHLIIIGEPGFCGFDPVSGTQQCVPISLPAGTVESQVSRPSAPAEGPSIFERSTLIPSSTLEKPPLASQMIPRSKPSSPPKLAKTMPPQSPAPRTALPVVVPKPQQWGFFKIDSAVPVDVLVDGWKKSMSNELTRLKLSPGEHQVTVIFPNGKQITIKRKIKAGKTVSLRLAYQDSL